MKAGVGGTHDEGLAAATSSSSREKSANIDFSRLLSGATERGGAGDVSGGAGKRHHSTRLAFLQKDGHISDPGRPPISVAWPTAATGPTTAVSTSGATAMRFDYPSELTSSQQRTFNRHSVVRRSLPTKIESNETAPATEHHTQQPLDMFINGRPAESGSTAWADSNSSSKSRRLKANVQRQKRASSKTTPTYNDHEIAIATGAVTNTTQELIRQKVSKRMYTFCPPLSTEEQANRAIGTPHNADGSRTGALSPRRISFRTKKRKPVLDKGSPVTAVNAESASVSTLGGGGGGGGAPSSWQLAEYDCSTTRGSSRSTIKRAMSLPRVNVSIDLDSKIPDLPIHDAIASLQNDITNAGGGGSAGDVTRARSLMSLPATELGDKEEQLGLASTLAITDAKSDNLATTKVKLERHSSRSNGEKKRSSRAPYTEALGTKCFEMASPGSSSAAPAKSKIMSTVHGKVCSV